MKKVLKAIWNEFIYGGHLLSLGAVGITFTISKLLDFQVTLPLLIIVYLFAQSMYSLNRYIEYEDDIETNLDRTQHIKTYVTKLPYIIAIELLAGIILLIVNNKLWALLFCVIPLLCGYLYSTHLKKLTSVIPGLKTIIVSFIWSLFVPFYVIYSGQEIRFAPFIFIFLFIFIRWFINTSFFDIKDITSDSKNKLKTLPIIFGRINYVRILHLLNLFSMFFLLLGILLGILPLSARLLLLLLPFTTLYLFLSTKISNAYVYYVMADSEFLLWALLIYLGDTIKWI